MIAVITKCTKCPKPELNLELSFRVLCTLHSDRAERRGRQPTAMAASFRACQSPEYITADFILFLSIVPHIPLAQLPSQTQITNPIMSFALFNPVKLQLRTLLVLLPSAPLSPIRPLPSPSRLTLVLSLMMRLRRV